MTINAALALIIVLTGGTGVEELLVVMGLTSDRRTPVLLALFRDFNHTQFALVALIDNVGNVLRLLIQRVGQTHG